MCLLSSNRRQSKNVNFPTHNESIYPLLYHSSYVNSNTTPKPGSALYTLSPVKPAIGESRLITGHSSLVADNSLDSSVQTVNHPKMPGILKKILSRPVQLLTQNYWGNKNEYASTQRFQAVSENELYLLGALEKLVYRVEKLERRLRRSEQLIYYLMEGNKQEEGKYCNECILHNMMYQLCITY